ncbi:cytochrome P450 9e2-like [Tribolium madens]|uniref:cytochrome P450 9e2-like n=1 Tax=Tribolium madens TaxID=41895 RepID=UPI001CF76003|nr:cytochrome P450 9e2-like [Tribolium madens]
MSNIISANMIWILSAITVFVSFYWFLICPYKHWTKRGVAQGNPVPIFGHMLSTILRKQSFSEMIQMVYNIAPDSRYCGMYQFFQPLLVLRDPELIKQITVKDFDYFMNHRGFIPADCEPLWGKILILLTNQKWKDMRNTLSPAFTSSKMKYMFALISESAQQFTGHFLRKSENVITIEMKDTFTRFTNDVIANTAFGVEIDSLEDRNNEFYLMGKEATNFGGFMQFVKFLTFLIFPKLAKYLKITFFSKKVGKFFTKIIKDNIANREKHGIVRPDMIHLLLEARKNGWKYEESETLDTGFATVKESNIGKIATVKQKITDEDIIAQAIIFFVGGFDPVSSIMSFMSYELAANPDVQEKLHLEIDKTFKTCEGKLTYEALIEMKYMDMVVSETLRLWPPNGMTDRVSSTSYVIEPKDPTEKPLQLEKGDLVMVPIFGIHRNPKYFPEPNRFDPERFNDEHKVNIKPYTYLPFGTGPRNCIGSRLALLEIKTLFFHFLSKFQIIPVEKTQIPLRINRKSFNITAENGFWLGLKQRGSDKL